MCPFMSANHDENQNVKLNKKQSTLSFCRNVADIFVVRNDDLWQLEGFI